MHARRICQCVQAGNPAVLPPIGGFPQRESGTPEPLWPS